MSSSDSETDTNFELEEDDVNEHLEGEHIPELGDATLEFEVASQCLELLGKEQSGLRYAYLLIAPVNRRLTDISVITQFKHILFVNISGNRLTTENIKCLAQLPFLLLIQADRNMIEFGTLAPIKYLQVINALFHRQYGDDVFFKVLTLNVNLIKTPAGIRQPGLECLELNCNQIADIAELDAKDVPNLKILEARGNLIKTINPLYFTNLDSLYLAENNIKHIRDLSHLVNLRILHLRHNKISKLRGFSKTMAKLQYINLRDNRIDKLTRLQKLRCLPAFDTLIVLQNPIMDIEKKMMGEEEEDEYGGEDDKISVRILILHILPNLKRINKDMVTDDEREALAAYELMMGITLIKFRGGDQVYSLS